MKYEFGFIGCGNMGGAIADAVAKVIDGKKLACADYDALKTARLCDAYGFDVADAAGVVSDSRFIVLGVKPQMMAQTLESVKEIFASRKDRFVFVTMAAGITCERLSELAGGNYPIIRIMPNTPASVGEGLILWCRNAFVSDAALQGFLEVMAPAGKLIEIDENKIDAASAVSGCGPAFVYMFIEALADGGVECGLPRDVAQKLASQTVLGAAKMVLESAKHPGELKDAVCSPGGSTISGVAALEKGAFRGTAASAVRAAYEKTLMLGK
jgi:pyrroline-5-carboxylate reductase